METAIIGGDVVSDVSYFIQRIEEKHDQYEINNK